MKTKKAIVINKGKGKPNEQTRYLEAFIDVFPNKQSIRCSVYYDQYQSFQSPDLAKKIIPWLSEHNFVVGGGYVPMYDHSTHQFGVLGAWDNQDMPIRIRLFDGSMQFFIDDVIER